VRRFAKENYALLVLANGIAQVVVKQKEALGLV
jgi:hypothetical protein